MGSGHGEGGAGMPLKIVNSDVVLNKMIYEQLNTVC